jgi:uncharacterized protein (TIGR02646 family)
VRPLTRTARPAALARADEWTARFVETATFRWPTVEGRTLNQHLTVLLAPLTDGHCSYCDAGNLGASSRSTIDHFRPKGAFPALAFAWENLFLACDACQAHKLEQFEEPLLKPDEPALTFERYFGYDAFSGRIVVNVAATPGEQERAAVTIRILGLNEEPRPSSRRTEVRKYLAARGELPLVDFSYRFAMAEA